MQTWKRFRMSHIPRYAMNQSGKCLVSPSRATFKRRAPAYLPAPRSVSWQSAQAWFRCPTLLKYRARPRSYAAAASGLVTSTFTGIPFDCILMRMVMLRLSALSASISLPVIAGAWTVRKSPTDMTRPYAGRYFGYLVATPFMAFSGPPAWQSAQAFPAGPLVDHEVTAFSLNRIAGLLVGSRLSP